MSVSIRLSVASAVLAFLAIATSAPAQTLVAQQPLYFTKVFGGANPLPQILTVTTNTGSNTGFSVSYTTTSGGSWLATSPSGNCCSTPQDIAVVVSPTTSLAAGTYAGQVTIATSTSTILVPVTLTIVAVNTASFSDVPGGLSYTMLPGGHPPSQIVHIGNAASGSLAWSLSTTATTASNFLTVSATSGTTPSELVVGVDTSKLPGGGSTAGVYTGQVLLQSTASNVSIPVSVTVGSDIFEQVNALTFTKPFGGDDPLPQVISIASTQTVIGISVGYYNATGGSWLSVTPSGNCCATPSALTVNVNPNVTLAAGTYTAEIVITATHRNLVIPVTLTVAAQNTTFMGNLPGGMSFTLPLNGPNPISQILQIGNGGSGSLAWTLTPTTFNGDNWLTVNATSGTAPSLVTVGIDATKLPNAAAVAGVYVGQILVTTNGSSVSVPIEVAVGTGFRQVNPLHFTMPFGGQNPLSQTVTFSSLGANFGFSVTYDTASGGNWLSVTPTGNCCATPDAVRASVTAPAGLAVGTYTGQIVAHSNNTAQIVPVTLTVYPSTSAFFDNLPGQLSFTLTPSGAPPSQVVYIGNGGTGTLAWTAQSTTSDGGAWLHISAASGTAPSTLTVSITPSNLPNAGQIAGVFNGTIELQTSGSLITIPVTVEVGANVLGQVNPLVFTMPQGGASPLPQTFTATSTGAAIGFSVTTDTATGGNWLTSSANGNCCATSQPITISINAPAGMAAGTYNGEVILNTSTTAMTVPVTLNVVPATSPMFDNLPGQLSYSLKTSGPNPPSQQVQIRNRGAGSLTWTAIPSTSDGGNWLTVSASSGTAPSLINVNVTASALPNSGVVAGVYSGQVLFISGTQAVTVPVSVAVGGNSFAQVNGLQFTMPEGGANPLPQVVTTSSIGAAIGYSVAYHNATGGNWLVVTPTGNCCGTPDTIQASVNAPAGLAAGTYTAEIIATGARSAMTIPVTLTVAPVNTAFFDNLQGQLSFSGKVGDALPSQTIQIRNAGTGTLTWTLLSSTADSGNWLTVSQTNGTAPSNVTIGVVPANLPNAGVVAGTYSGQILLQSSTSQVTIPVVVEIGPTEFNEAGGISFTMPYGGPAPLNQTLTVTSTGSAIGFSSAGYTGNGGAWMTVAPTGNCCGTPATMTFHVASTSLPVGTYTAEAIFTKSTGAMVVPVTITVTNSLSINPTTATFGSAGGTGTVTVTGSSGWTAISNSSFITITGGGSGTGNGTVQYSVAGNASTSGRSGTMTIAGQTFTVTQTGAAAVGISPASTTINSSGGSRSIGVTSTGAWAATSNATWITVSSGGTGTGNGTVGLTVAANTTGAQRVGTVNVGSAVFTVTQAAAGAGGPAVIDVSPFVGTGYSQVFTVEYTESAGFADIATAEFMVNITLSPSDSCYVKYDASANTFRLISNDAVNFLGPITPGSGSLSNAACTLDGTNSSVTGSGNNLTIRYAITFQTGFGGKRSMFATVTDYVGRTPGWLAFGVWWPNPTTGTLTNWYRLYEPATSSHHYTTDFNEYTVLQSRGFNGEGSAGQIYSAPFGSAVPYYRIYLMGPRTHFWTTDRNEYIGLIRFGGVYAGEGIDGFLLPPSAPAPGTLPYYRMVYCCSAVPIHHWTTDANEYNTLLKQGWNSEGITGYLFPPAATGSAKPAAVTISSTASKDWNAVAPGELVTVAGNGLAHAEVTIDGFRARVVHASRDELQVLVPEQVRPNSIATVRVHDGKTLRLLSNLRVDAAHPAIFASDAYGKGEALDHQVAPGDRIQLYATGLGKGLPVTVHIGGRRAKVVDLVTVDGKTRLTVEVPRDLGSGPAAVRLRSGEFVSQGGVTLTIP